VHCPLFRRRFDAAGRCLEARPLLRNQSQPLGEESNRLTLRPGALAILERHDSTQAHSRSFRELFLSQVSNHPVTPKERTED
jgi:hypothetical protein